MQWVGPHVHCSKCRIASNGLLSTSNARARNLRGDRVVTLARDAAHVI